MERRESCQKRQRAFEEPQPSFELVDTSSREPYPKKPKSDLSQNYQRWHEMGRLYQKNSNLAAQVETLKIEQECILRQLEEHRSKVAKLELELELKETKASELKRKLLKVCKSYARAESARKSLVYQKKYFLRIIGGFFGKTSEEAILKEISEIEDQPSKDRAVTPEKKPIMRFRAAVRVCIAVHRYIHLHFDGTSRTI